MVYDFGLRLAEPICLIKTVAACCLWLPTQSISPYLCGSVRQSEVSKLVRASLEIHKRHWGAPSKQQATGLWRPYIDQAAARFTPICTHGSAKVLLSLAFSIYANSKLTFKLEFLCGGSSHFSCIAPYLKGLDFVKAAFLAATYTYHTISTTKARCWK